MDRQELYRKWMRRELERSSKTQVALGEAIGLDSVKMSKSMNGTRKFQAPELELAAEFLGSPIPKGLHIVGSFDPDEHDRDPSAGTERPVHVSIPDGHIGELENRAGLGPGDLVVSGDTGELRSQDAYKDEFWRFPQSFTRDVIKAQIGNLVAIECTGDSMEPTIRAHERVWVDRTQNLLSPEGLYAIRDPHGAIEVKRLQYTDDKPRRIAVISDNERHPIRVREPEDVPIVGRVVCVMKVF